MQFDQLKRCDFIALISGVAAACPAGALDWILLGWRFRRRARCGDSAAMAMVLRRRATGERAEDSSIGACRGQIDTDAGGPLHDARKDLDQPKADRRELCGR
jgi:hypothetical protein